MSENCIHFAFSNQTQGCRNYKNAQCSDVEVEKGGRKQDKARRDERQGLKIIAA